MESIANHGVRKGELDAIKAEMEKLERKVELVQHKCLKEDTLRHIVGMLTSLQSTNERVVGELGSWKFFRRAFVPILGVIITIGIAAILAVASLRSDVANAEEAARNASKQIQIIAPLQKKLEVEVDTIKRGDNGAKKLDQILLEIKRLDSVIKTKKK